MPVTYPESWSRLNTVLCHDWLTGMRGGERVLELLCRGFPSAPVYTLLHNRAAVSDAINRHRIVTSPLQRLPGIHERYRYFLPTFPAAMATLHPPAADLLLSTSHCVAKSIRAVGQTPHLCYCFTPMRYAWLFQDEYLGGQPVKRLLAQPILAWLRSWDRRTASRVTSFVAISKHVRERIRLFYGREAEVVYPPVDLDRWTPAPDSTPGEFDLIASALVPYKRIDLAVAAYARRDRRLKIVGTGTEFRRLKAMATANIEFLGWQPDEVLLDLYRRCRLLLFPGEEDFGIVPLEVQACGRPVVAYGRGGVLETVRDGVSGVFFGEQTSEALRDALERAGSIAWDPQAIRAHVQPFGIQHFLNDLDRSIQALVRK